jgi:uncharacterized protein (TIGR00255 family)
MTGFGQAEVSDGRWRVAIGARSVNHRFLDVAVRLPDERRALEPSLRALVSEVTTRGRVEVWVEIESLSEEAPRLEVDQEGLAAVARATEDLVRAGLVQGGLTVGDLLRAGDLLRLRRAEPVWSAAEQALVNEAAKAALAELVAGRAAEGERLEGILAARLAGLEAQAERLTARREGMRDELAAGLRRRLSDLLVDTQIPEERLAFEVALLVERSDVQEELDRLRAHLHHCRELLAEGAGVGRRLDFLAQEVQRELNTLGAKCRDLAMIEAVVEAKLICEQLREQVQNVE